LFRVGRTSVRRLLTAADVEGFGSRPVKRRMWSRWSKEFAASIERQRAQIVTNAKALGIQPTRFGFGG
jgi:hypothetical protein